MKLQLLGMIVLALVGAGLFAVLIGIVSNLLSGR
jgi:hypothetical protein